jgi:hypothetical protein
MSASSRDTGALAPAAHLDRLLALVDEVDFVEQLSHAEELIDRRRDALVRERRAAVRARRSRSADGGNDERI